MHIECEKLPVAEEAKLNFVTVLTSSEDSANNLFLHCIARNLVRY